MSRFKKMLLGAVTAMVLATGVAVSPASATVPTKGVHALDANVPYLAWRGENVRLGFCPPVRNGETPEAAIVVPGGISPLANVSWALEDWSGDPANGSVAVPQELFGQRDNYHGCVYTEFTSQKAGVAFIKLVVSTPGFLGGNAVEAVYTKQFMVAWMELGTPAVTGGGPVNAGDCNVQSTNTAFKYLIDPYRVCDPAADNTHLITALVKGTIPLKANFHEWGLGNHLTMPDDWAKWAAVAARSSQPDWSQAAYVSNWDIHDDKTDVEGHVPGLCVDAATNAAGTTDAVDNCLYYTDEPTTGFGGYTGPFSTVLGTLTTDNAIGPFDPIYTYDTLLSNGTVDEGDAPMPAAQIDVMIKENSGGAGRHQRRGLPRRG